MAVKGGFGLALWVNTGGGLVVIPKLKDVTPPDPTVGTWDARTHELAWTTMALTGTWDVAPVQFTVLRDTTSSVQNALRAGILAPSESWTWRVVLPNGNAYDFPGILTKFKDSSPMKEGINTVGEIQFRGAVTHSS